MEVANFFWHGANFSCYERACLSSFVFHGFKVRLWSYHDLNSPNGIMVCDASSIYPESDILKYTQSGKRGSLASFSNFFRYKLLADHDGWWFDTDVLCLKRQSEFFPGVDLVFGFQGGGVINGGILKVDNEFSQDLLAKANEVGLAKGWNFDWGDAGPHLITALVNARNMAGFAQNESVFYPLPYSNALDALDPDKVVEVEELCHDSYTYHIWNEILRIKGVSKDLMPPKGSYLYKKFIEYDPGLIEVQSLSLDAFHKCKVSV